MIFIITFFVVFFSLIFFNFNFSFNSIKNETTYFFKKYGKFFHYVGKLFSFAFLTLLLLVGAFLIYYLISVKRVQSGEVTKPKISLYTIVSGSMEPAINVYDVILVWSVDKAEDIKKGDVITFISTSSISEGLLVTHRVHDIKNVDGKIEYVTKGDYNAVADSSTAKFDNVVGKVLFKLPQLGRIQFFVASKLGWFLVVLLPALGVIIYDIFKLVKLMNASDASKAVKNKMLKVNTTGDAKLDNILSDINKSDYNSAQNLEIKKIDDKEDFIKRLNELKNMKK